MTRSRWLMLLCCAALSACSMLAARDAARERAEAKADDAHCRLEGTSFPSAGYDSCRRRLQEERRQKQWLELSLLRQQSLDRTPETVPPQAPGTFLAIDPAHYACEQLGSGPDGFIACRER